MACISCLSSKEDVNVASLTIKKRVVLSALCALALTTGTAVAGLDVRDVPWKVRAEKMTRSIDNQDVIAIGGVEVVRTGTPDKPMNIYADWVRYDVEKGIVYARGNVRMRSNGERVYADKATIVLADETASLFDSDVYLAEQNLHFRAKEVRKDGEMTYRFTDAIFTTCDFDDENPPVWSLESKDIDIDIDGFIWLKHSFLNIKDVPVLYLPIMGFPGRMDRQTGFLIPEVSNSSLSGNGLITPFFVNLSPSSDLTLYPGYLSNRGVLGGAEFRHVNDIDSKFTLIGTYINDRTGDTIDDDFKDDGYLRTKQDRYWLRGKADHDFGNNLTGRMDFDTASDRDYLMEFDKGLMGFDQSNKTLLGDYGRGLQNETLGWRQSSAQIDKTWDTAFLGGKMTLVDDLDPGATPDTKAVQSLPHVVSRGNYELWDSGVNFNWDADYSNYYRKEGVGTQRVALSPRFDAPLALTDWLEASVSGGLDQAFWSVEEYGSDANWSEDSNPTRTSWAGKIDLATSFHRNFGLDMGRTSFFNHLVRPEVTYTYVDVSENDQSDLPDFDERDRITERSIVGYGFSNYFRLGGLNSENMAWSRYFGHFKVKQGYDFDLDEHPLSDLDFDLDIYPINGLRVSYNTSLSMYGDGVVSYDLLTRYTSSRGNFASIDYVYDKFGGVHSINADAQMRFTRTLAGRVEFKQSLAEDNTVSQSVALLYQPGCWGMKIEYSDRNEDQRVAVMFSLVGAGQSYGFGYGSSSGGDEMFSNMDDLELNNGY
jgi:LPS-assembly protein